MMPDTRKPVPYEQYGHEFSHPEWMQLMIHFYRAEMNRATVWRQRLDVTTNWAVAATAGMLTFILGTGLAPDDTILLAVGLSLVMLHIEARRYMYYDIWRSRLRMLERGLIAPALWKDAAQRELEHEGEWRRLLAEDLQRARFHMPYYEAFGRRLSRIYIWLLLLDYAAWIIKLGIWPIPAHDFHSLIRHAQTANISGGTIFAIATGLLGLAIVVGPLLTLRRRARGEAEGYKHEPGDERWGIV
ncbi:MAG: DUF2270 domain-containing protein [Armatimonadota bacterium]